MKPETSPVKQTRLKLSYSAKARFLGCMKLSVVLVLHPFFSLLLFQLSPKHSRWPPRLRPLLSPRVVMSRSLVTSPGNSPSPPTCPSPGCWRKEEHPKRFWLLGLRAMWSQGPSMHAVTLMEPSVWCPGGMDCLSSSFPEWQRLMKGFTSAMELSGHMKMGANGLKLWGAQRKWELLPLLQQVRSTRILKTQRRNEK